MAYLRKASRTGLGVALAVPVAARTETTAFRGLLDDVSHGLKPLLLALGGFGKWARHLARAIDEHRADLRWFVRPYSYDPRTVFRSQDVPLHPGAARYYRERGYLP